MDQKTHAENWLLYPDNIGPFLTIDETSMSHGELYAIIINKAAHGRKGTIVAMIKGTDAKEVINVLMKIPQKIRDTVQEVTMDMAPSMIKIITRSFLVQ